MKRNMMGETIAEPGDDYDDFALPFMEANELDAPPEVVRAAIGEDPTFGWCATMFTDEFAEIQAHGFPSKDALVTWLKDVVRLPERDIEDES